MTNHDPEAEPIGDDYHEPEYTHTGSEPEPETDPREALNEPLAPVEGPVGEYAAYDPTLARPSRFDRLTEDNEPVLVDEEGNTLPTFDPQHREDFHGLTFIGALSKTFEWLGHRFVIRTLTVDEALGVAWLTKTWDETLGGPLAYRTAMAALCVQKVDGKDLPIPIGEEGDFAYFQQRFDYAKARWFQFTIDAIYAEYLVLEGKARAVVAAMGKASAPTASIPG